MKKLINVTAATMLAAALPLTAAPALAQVNADDQINKRQMNIRDRLNDGVRKGLLTRDEAMPLRQELTAITRYEIQLRQGGLTNDERKLVNQRLNALSEQVRDGRHNEFTRF